MDLYGADGNAVAMGNARRREVRDLNERIRAHNTEIADKISGLKDQAKTTQTITELKNTGQAIWTGKGMPDRIKAFNDYFEKDKPTTGNPTSEETATQRSNTTSIEDDADEPLFDNPPAEPVAEGSNAGRSVGEEIENVAGDGEGTSMLKKGLGAVEEAGDLTAGGLAKSGLKKLGGAAGVFGEAAIGGLDLYDDIKSKSIVGNNNWEKAANIMQIGGAAMDIIGLGFPPAKLLGGVLDLAGAGVNTIGEAEDTTTSDDLNKLKENQTEQEITAPRQEVITTGRTE
tara:strand:+ start:3600 stop:4457 length:858 start_codon:yes stop_codon:yes gene_type:complete